MFKLLSHTNCYNPSIFLPDWTLSFARQDSAHKRKKWFFLPVHSIPTIHATACSLVERLADVGKAELAADTPPLGSRLLARLLGRLGLEDRVGPRDPAAPALVVSVADAPAGRIGSEAVPDEVA